MGSVINQLKWNWRSEHNFNHFKVTRADSIMLTLGYSPLSLLPLRSMVKETLLAPGPAPDWSLVPCPDDGNVSGPGATIPHTHTWSGPHLARLRERVTFLISFKTIVHNFHFQGSLSQGELYCRKEKVTRIKLKFFSLNDLNFRDRTICFECFKNYLYF